MQMCPGIRIACSLSVRPGQVNVLAREYCESIKRKNKPIVLSHHMLMGLKQGQEKMSKSDPESAIFMEDSEDEARGIPFPFPLPTHSPQSSHRPDCCFQ